MTSPILGPFVQEPPNKRAISVLDQEYDLMGLSRNNAIDEESYHLEEHGGMSPPLAILDDEIKDD